MKNIKVGINSKSFIFSPASVVSVHGYDLKIIEPGFDSDTSKIVEQFTNCWIGLPPSISCRVERTSLDPCAKIYLDAEGKKMLTAYFD